MDASGASPVRLSGCFYGGPADAGIRCALYSGRIETILARGIFAAVVILGIVLLAALSTRLPAPAPELKARFGRDEAGLVAVERLHERDFRSRWMAPHRWARTALEGLDWSPAGGLSPLLLNIRGSKENPEQASTASQFTPLPVESDDRTTSKLQAPLPIPSPLDRDRASERFASTRQEPIARKPERLGGLQFLFRFFNSNKPSARALLAANPQTAIYDINNHVVYMPHGEQLEAHSGFGPFLDDPSSVDRHNLGPTPPNFYELSLRPALFHGVQALRMTPVGEGKMFGRSGFLAHPYMLGDDGASNGCLSIRNYEAFLRAYQIGEVKRVIVLPRLDAQPASLAQAGPDGH